ncbi:uncharacterized protein LOC142590697 [Dermacentor variabilis]|uniref:uncharacterized protein LOC142590697 n=1 Tax=Dermacentor variabilis TaxID=34621 RepID=UPI003F5AF3F6
MPSRLTAYRNIQVALKFYPSHATYSGQASSELRITRLNASVSNQFSTDANTHKLWGKSANKSTIRYADIGYMIKGSRQRHSWLPRCWFCSRAHSSRTLRIVTGSGTAKAGLSGRRHCRCRFCPRRRS